jgi:hypothetical protein
MPMSSWGRWFVCLGLVALPVAAHAQTTIESYVSGGVANVRFPSFSGGADVVTGPYGVSVGGSGTIVTSVTEGPWALYLLSARVGLHGEPRPRAPSTRTFMAGELSIINDTDCCRASAAIGASVGMQHWFTDRRAIRAEGRIMRTLDGEGAIVLIEVGLTFRPSR